MPAMRAMVLAAGLGTRLGDLSDERPKPLLPVADVPILRYVLASLAGHGVTEVCINLHHHGALIRAELDELTHGNTNPSVTWSDEQPDILGTGGALKKMGDWLTRGGRDSFLVMNGKLVCDIDLSSLMREHTERAPLATLVVRAAPDAARWGAIDVGDDGRVKNILGAGGHMFTGVHAISPALVERLPDGVSCSIRQGYLPALGEGLPLRALVYDGYFQEHSTPERYLDGNLAVVRGEARLTFAPGPSSGVDDSAVFGPGVERLGALRVGAHAIVGAGATLGPDVVIGARARVAPGVRLERAVVWPDSTVDQDVRDAIVTPRGVHPVSRTSGAPTP